MTQVCSAVWPPTFYPTHIPYSTFGHTHLALMPLLLVQGGFKRSNFGIAIGSLCTFSTEILSGSGCGRGEPNDVCWLVSIQTLADLDAASCAKSLAKPSCAQSALDFFIYQSMDASTIPKADCVYFPAASPASSGASVSATRSASDLEAAFDVQSDTLCGANAYGTDDGYRCVRRLHLNMCELVLSALVLPKSDSFVSALLF